MAEEEHARLERATADLQAPFALVDLDAMWANAVDMERRAAPKPIIASFIAVHEDEATARDMFEKYIRGYARSAVAHYEFHNEGLADIPGYEYYGKLASNIRKHGLELHLVRPEAGRVHVRDVVGNRVEALLQCDLRG